jgi:hypothetical protein
MTEKKSIEVNINFPESVPLLKKLSKIGYDLYSQNENTKNILTEHGINSNQDYIEHFRLNASIKRIAGFLKKVKNKNSRFDVLATLNVYKNPKGIISYCLFGDTSKKDFHNNYVKPFLNNQIPFTHDPIRGWVGRVYISSSISPEIYSQLIEKGYELFIMNEDPEEKFRGLLWRFLPAGDIIPFIVHDADMNIKHNSIIIAGLENIPGWLRSDKIFFRRKIFPSNIFWPMSAGAWGAKPTKENKPPIPNIQSIIEKYNHDWFGTDESFLYNEIWPLTRNNGCYTIYSTIEKIIGLIFIILIAIIVGIILYKIIHSKK